MTRKYPVNTTQTIDTINRLHDAGVKKIGAIIRHSDRNYSKDPIMEPFMGLTENGKGYAYDFGRQLRAEHPPKLYSSLMGRCVETAYLIDKGFSAANGTTPEHNTLDHLLFAFYIKDWAKALKIVAKEGTHTFLRKWFDGELEDGIMQNARTATNRISEFMVEKTSMLENGQVAICASHDWNIFPIKEFKLGLPHETYGDIGYLDSVVFFEKDNRFFVTSYQAEQPVPL